MLHEFLHVIFISTNQLLVQIISSIITSNQNSNQKIFHNWHELDKSASASYNKH